MVEHISTILEQYFEVLDKRVSNRSRINGMKYQKWDWKQAVSQHSVETANWLWNNHKRKMSFEEFKAEWSALPHDHKRPSKCKSPSNIRIKYNSMKNKFGFFTGELAA